MMEKSEQINELATALAKAQGEFKAVPKTGKNPFFKSDYITLDGIIAAIKSPLSNNGIAYTQLLSSADNGHSLTTMLIHTSGQWIASTCVVNVASEQRGRNPMQSLGSSLTYMKRYALAAILGISSDDDDDGNGQTKAFSSPDAAIKWGLGQGAFEAEKHARNAYNRLKNKEHPSTAAEMAVLWREDVARRLDNLETKEEASTSNAGGNGSATDELVKTAIEDLGTVIADDEIPEAVREAMNYKTPKGTRLGDCDDTQLSKLLEWCDENPKSKRAIEIGRHVIRLVDYRAAEGLEL